MAPRHCITTLDMTTIGITKLRTISIISKVSISKRGPDDPAKAIECRCDAECLNLIIVGIVAIVPYTRLERLATDKQKPINVKLL
jgi:hypothetical protein